MNSPKTRPSFTLLSILLFSLILNGCNLTDNKPTPHNGLTFESIQNNNHQFYLALFSPAEDQLQIIENLDHNKASTIEEIHKQFNSLFSFNGGFFSEKFTPSGLLFSQGKEMSPLVKADLLDGIFTIDENNQPKLYNYDEFKKVYHTLKLNFAIQNGPILIDDQGQTAISNKSVKKANRTALGITKDGQVVVIIDRETILDSDKAPTLYQFADQIQNNSELQALGIHSVLNLDGGPSTGLAYDDQYYSELEKVQNVIIIKPLQNG